MSWCIPIPWRFGSVLQHSRHHCIYQIGCPRIGVTKLWTHIHVKIHPPIPIRIYPYTTCYTMAVHKLEQPNSVSHILRWLQWSIGMTTHWFPSSGPIHVEHTNRMLCTLPQLVCTGRICEPTPHQRMSFGVSSGNSSNLHWFIILYLQWCVFGIGI